MLKAFPITWVFEEFGVRCNFLTFPTGSVAIALLSQNLAT
jgi:hypothetical protein